jgi:hypothetical protein
VSVLTLVVPYLLIQLVLLLPFALVLIAVSRLMRKRSASMRTLSAVITATILFTPGMAPATIALAPVPFGLLFGFALITFAWPQLIQLMALTPIWYVVAFPATATIAYCCHKLLLSNYRWSGP